jgi:hypothetical protein
MSMGVSETPLDDGWWVGNFSVSGKGPVQIEAFFDFDAGYPRFY